MALEAKLVQRLGQTQQLLMTPQLQQAIKLLQLGRLEYIEAIQKELLENPILEELGADEGMATPRESSPEELTSRLSERKAESPSSPSTEVPIDNPVGESSGDLWEYLDQASRTGESFSRKSGADSEDRPSIEATASREETLTEHLIRQVRMAEFTEDETRVALHIIGNLGRDGYLSISIEELVEATGQPVDAVERVLKVVQYFDPIGVGARNLQECLLVQLDAMGMGEQLEGKIIRDYLDKLERQKFDLIAKAEGAPLERVHSAVRFIRTLEPRPGRPFADEATRYVQPDIYVNKIGNEFVVTLNDEGIPRLRVNPTYLQMLKSTQRDPSLSKDYLTERIKSASWLIKSIHQRQSTIFKVTQSIVKFQREFFDKGIAYLRPLVLKDVADDIGMHESTVSRVTTDKYVHTPQGIFELKFFFTNAIKSAGGDISSSSVKERIRALIAAEPPHRPISDQEIVDILNRENIDIARRTVAKYRESLGILSSTKRKKVI